MYSYWRSNLKEHQFVYSSFYYPKRGGSQLLANRLSQNLDIVYNTDITSITRYGEKWKANIAKVDCVIFCGNIKQLPLLLHNAVDILAYEADIEALESHGTTSVFCEIDKNPYSWMYMPSDKYESHCIICTGNFSPTNNAPGRMTSTIEFADYISKEDILDNLSRIPYHPRYLTH